MKYSPYNKTSEMAKFIIDLFRRFPNTNVNSVASACKRSVANVRYLKGVAYGNN
jgi:hypothetical protein